MRKLGNVLFIQSEDVYLSKDGENAVANLADGTKKYFPFHDLDGIISFSYKGGSVDLMAACVERGVNLAFCDPGFRFRVRVAGVSRGNVLLRREQYRMADDEIRSCRIARYMIFGKMQGCCRVLDRFRRDHGPRIDIGEFKAVSERISELSRKLLEMDRRDEIRGIEAAGASAYFSLFDDMVLGDKATFGFHGRNRRPPEDPMNALLSYVYAITQHCCESALEAYGVDSCVGVLHSDRSGKPSMALDLMEEMRPYLADRFVFRLVNNRMVGPKDFLYMDSGAVRLDKSGRQIVGKAWRDYMREIVTVRAPKEQKVARGLVPYVQAQILAACIRGDRADYLPFLWR